MQHYTNIFARASRLRDIAILAAEFWEAYLASDASDAAAEFRLPGFLVRKNTDIYTRGYHKTALFFLVTFVRYMVYG